MATNPTWLDCVPSRNQNDMKVFQITSILSLLLAIWIWGYSFLFLIEIHQNDIKVKNILWFFACFGVADRDAEDEQRKNEVQMNRFRVQFFFLQSNLWLWHCVCALGAPPWPMLMRFVVTGAQAGRLHFIATMMAMVMMMMWRAQYNPCAMCMTALKYFLIIMVYWVSTLMAFFHPCTVMQIFGSISVYH